MTPRKSAPLISHAEFISQLTRNICIGLLFIIIALSIGMLGYHYFEQLSWIDAFLNASMILSGMGQVNPLQTSGGKIFASCYALFSGMGFLAIIALIFAPAIHRFFHKMHIEINGDD